MDQIYAKKSLREFDRVGQIKRQKLIYTGTHLYSHFQVAHYHCYILVSAEILYYMQNTVGIKLDSKVYSICSQDSEPVFIDYTSAILW